MEFKKSMFNAQKVYLIQLSSHDTLNNSNIMPNIFQLLSNIILPEVTLQQLQLLPLTIRHQLQVIAMHSSL